MILLLCEYKHLERFSKLHQCTFNLTLRCLETVLSDYNQFQWRQSYVNRISPSQLSDQVLNAPLVTAFFITRSSFFQLVTAFFITRSSFFQLFKVSCTINWISTCHVQRSGDVVRCNGDKRNIKLSREHESLKLLPQLYHLLKETHLHHCRCLDNTMSK